MKIVQASFWSKAMQPLANITWNNKMGYAQKHGYDSFTSYHEPDVDRMWDRPRKWGETLDNATDGTICLFTGCDVFITCPELKLETWLNYEDDAFLLIDHGYIFGDIHLWRASDKTRKFMHIITERSHPLAKKCWCEQDAFTVALSNLTLGQFTIECGQAFGTPDYYAKAEKLLSATDIKVKSLSLTKFSGDDPVNWPIGEIPAHHSWTKEHLMLHLGGISDERRIAYLNGYMAAKS